MWWTLSKTIKLKNLFFIQSTWNFFSLTIKFPSILFWLKVHRSLLSRVTILTSFFLDHSSDLFFSILKRLNNFHSHPLLSSSAISSIFLLILLKVQLCRLPLVCFIIFRLLLFILCNLINSCRRIMVVY